MEELPRISVEQVRNILFQNVDVAAQKVTDALNQAKPGQLIADSEEPFRDIMSEFSRAAYEAVLQAKVDAAEAAFPPSAGDGLRSGCEAVQDQAVS